MRETAAGSLKICWPCPVCDWAAVAAMAGPCWPWMARECCCSWPRGGNGVPATGEEEEEDGGRERGNKKRKKGRKGGISKEN